MAARFQRDYQPGDEFLERSSQCNSWSGFKGVSFVQSRPSKPWRLTNSGRSRYFATALKAARARHTDLTSSAQEVDRARRIHRALSAAGDGEEQEDEEAEFEEGGLPTEEGDLELRESGFQGVTQMGKEHMGEEQKDGASAQPVLGMPVYVYWEGNALCPQGASFKTGWYEGRIRPPERAVARKQTYGVTYRYDDGEDECTYEHLLPCHRVPYMRDAAQQGQWYQDTPMPGDDQLERSSSNSKKSQSGYTGVHVHVQSGRYQAMVRQHGHVHWKALTGTLGGMYDSAIEAARARHDYLARVGGPRVARAAIPMSELHVSDKGGEQQEEDGKDEEHSLPAEDGDLELRESGFHGVTQNPDGTSEKAEVKPLTKRPRKRAKKGDGEIPKKVYGNTVHNMPSGYPVGTEVELLQVEKIIPAGVRFRKGLAKGDRGNVVGMHKGRMTCRMQCSGDVDMAPFQCDVGFTAAERQTCLKVVQPGPGHRDSGDGGVGKLPVIPGGRGKPSRGAAPAAAQAGPQAAPAGDCASDCAAVR